MKLVELIFTISTMATLENDYDIPDVKKYIRDNYPDLVQPVGDFRIVEWQSKEVMQLWKK